MKLLLIRHGETKGNKERRYVGSTDEELLEESRQRLVKLHLHTTAEHIYTSPLRRCRETAALLFPGKEQIAVEELRECDFGEFEYCNYAQLNGNPDYQRFIDTMGKSGFPGGENMADFQKRCVRGFLGLAEIRDYEVRTDEEQLVLVVHGGTIMAILDAFSSPHKDYYDWQIGNGKGFEAKVERTADSSLRLTGIRAVRELDG